MPFTTVNVLEELFVHDCEVAMMGFKVIAPPSVTAPAPASIVMPPEPIVRAWVAVVPVTSVLPLLKKAIPAIEAPALR